ncbi:hypothetical protein JOD54_005980 [Actinokineospora baliensis]|uniref:hypothetical protein n=1 Tax=Actinokineospora baliensis TaxID=547056 RepID=UPI00195BD8F5|nr:hypothetical protein [Actinokineospora baliensis]MBM7775776.1 hypothetical protein [Actinokineospora baliensis]
MLFIVLALVLGAFGLLVAALTTANTVWAWISVVISVVAAAILLVDWLGARRRRVPADTAPPGPIGAPDIERIDPAPPVEPLDTGQARFEPYSAPPEPADLYPSADQAVGGAVGQVEVDQDREPDEESTDAADLLVVSDLRADVRVLDERPRYHLARCGWLGARSSIPLPVAEARQLGFTPCAHCTPDAVLAAQYREGRLRPGEGAPTSE